MALPWRAIIFIVLPSLLLGGGTFYTRWQLDQARASLVPIESVDWTWNGQPLPVRVVRTVEHELETFVIVVEHPDTPYETTFESTTTCLVAAWSAALTWITMALRNFCC